jgi:hypothetical protein
VILTGVEGNPPYEYPGRMRLEEMSQEMGSPLRMEDPHTLSNSRAGPRRDFNASITVLWHCETSDEKGRMMAHRRAISTQPQDARGSVSR